MIVCMHSYMHMIVHTKKMIFDYLIHIQIIIAHVSLWTF